MATDNNNYQSLKHSYDCHCYNVAGHAFALYTLPDSRLSDELEQYAPFAIEATGDVLFSVYVVAADDWCGTEGFKAEVHQNDEGSEIIAGQVGRCPCFEFRLYGEHSATLLTAHDYSRGWLLAERHHTYGVNNALMVMYALATACRRTALFHSSVVGFNHHGYMFLGLSGTGKSTHSRLWLQHIEGAELLNDDNPVVRIIDEKAYVYGSPWSGKTPCYRKVVEPLGALVQLAQAPENHIRRIRGIEAYASLLPSISGKRWDSRLADGLHETEEWIAAHVPMYRLDCLPDKAAAQLCCATIAAHVDAASHDVAAVEHRVIDHETAIHAAAEMLDEGRRVILPVRGNSMLPFITGGYDSVELVKQQSGYAVGDIVLARVDDGRYVVHRILDVDAAGRLTLMGDGNIGYREHCDMSDVIARAEYAVNAKGRRHLYTRARRVGAACWFYLLPVRRWLLAVYRRLPMTDYRKSEDKQ